MSGARLAALAGGLSAAALGAILLAYLIPVHVPAPEYGGGAPGPQAFPRTLAWGLIIMGGLDIVGVFLAREDVAWRRPEALGRLGLVAAIIVATLLAIPWIGMLAAGVGLMIAITTLASGQRLLPSIATAVLFAAAIYLIFVLIAGIPLPVGSLWE